MKTKNKIEKENLISQKKVTKIKNKEVPSISNVLRLLRISNDLSIKELSEQTGISVSYISDIEKGKSAKPSLEIIDKYSKALNIKKTTIMFFEEEFDERKLPYQKMLLSILQKIAD